MKRLAMLFIFLIGMISQTSMASTPLTEQKQKTTIEKSVIQMQEVVAVDFEFAVLGYDLAFANVVKKNDLGNGSNPLKLSQAILVDEYWSANIKQFKFIPYTEKLNSNYIIDKANMLQVIGLDSARDNC